MNTPIIPQPPINKRVLEVTLQTCLEIVEKSPEVQELIKRHSKAVGATHHKVDKETFDYIENAIWEASAIYGAKMFRMGLAIGRNPAAIFDLPDVDI